MFPTGLSKQVNGTTPLSFSGANSSLHVWKGYLVPYGITNNRLSESLGATKTICLTRKLYIMTSHRLKIIKIIIRSNQGRKEGRNGYLII
jgi:hypothetical protein